MQFGKFLCWDDKVYHKRKIKIYYYFLCQEVFFNPSLYFIWAISFVQLQKINQIQGQRSQLSISNKKKLETKKERMKEKQKEKDREENLLGATRNPNRGSAIFFN